MVREEVFREVDDWIARPLPAGIEETLDALRVEEEERRGAVREAQESLTQVQIQIAKFEDALQLKRYIESRGDRGTASPAHAQPANGAAPSRGRQAVLRLLSEFPPEREWTIPEIVSSLAAREWAKPDDHHAVGVSLSRLARAGKIHRVVKGVYRLEPVEASSVMEDGQDTANSTHEGEPLS